MTPRERQMILDYIRAQRLAVIASVSASGAPQAALVGVAITGALEIIFDTVSTSRKHANLIIDSRVALTFGGVGEKTLQYEGRAHMIDVNAESGHLYLEAYYAVWPDGRARRAWPNIAYWLISPTWIRYSDYDCGPLIIESTFD